MIKNTATSLIFPLLLVFYEISMYLSNDMYLPALPEMMRELHLSAPQIQLTLTWWFIGSATMPIVVGILADRFNRRLVLLSGGLVYILSNLMCAFSNSLGLLLLSRFIQGATLSSMMIPGYASIHELFEQKEAVKILALMGSITIIAPAVGPLLGGIILLVTSWRGIFIFLTALALISVSCLYKWMPATKATTDRIEVNVLFKQYGRVLSNTRFMTLLFILGFNFCGFICWITSGSLLVVENFHYSVMVFALLQALIFVSYIVGNYAVKHLVERWDLTQLVERSMTLILTSGMLCFICAYFFPNSLSLFILCFMLFSFASAGAYAPLNRMIIESSNEPMSIRMAFLTMSLTFFAILASVLSASFFTGSLISLARLVLFSTLSAFVFYVLSWFIKKAAK